MNTSSGSHKTQVRNTSDQPLTNQFSNDGSFLEQFRKLKQAKDEPKVEAKVELKIEAKVEPKVEPKVELQNKELSLRKQTLELELESRNFLTTL